MVRYIALNFKYYIIILRLPRNGESSIKALRSQREVCLSLRNKVLRRESGRRKMGVVLADKTLMNR